MPIAAYLIMHHSFELDDLLNSFDTLTSDYAVTQADSAIVIESRTQCDYCRFELETRESLLDDWYPDNPVFDLLLHNAHFGGSSSAYYATFNFPASSPFVAAVQSLCDRNIDCIVYNCHDMTASGRDFLSALAANPDWQWHSENLES